MKEILKRLLESIGVANDKIDEFTAALEKPEENKDYDTKPIVDAVVAHQKNLLENDSEFIKTFTDAELAKNLSVFERKVSQAAKLTSEETKGKKWEEILSIAVAKLSKPDNAAAQKLQEELITANNRIKELEEVEIPKIKSEVDTTKQSMLVTDKLRSFVSSKFKLRNPIEAVLPVVQSSLSGYDVKINDSGEVEISKDGLQIKNADGTKILTSEDIIKGVLETSNFLEKSNADGGGEGGNPTVIVKKEGEPGAPDHTATAPHMSEAEKHLAEIEANKNVGHVTQE